MSIAALVRARGATLLDALDQHLPGSREHADGTASYAFAVAVERRATRADAEAVRETARLHEIGKVYVPAALLAVEPERLDPPQLERVRSHPAYAAELARGAGVPDRACDWISALGERFDGAGPGGLAGERIPLEARLIRAACACDALLSSPAGSDSTERRGPALAELRARGGGELDPGLVNVLAGIVERAAAGPRA